MRMAQERYSQCIPLQTPLLGLRDRSGMELGEQVRDRLSIEGRTKLAVESRVAREETGPRVPQK